MLEQLSNEDAREMIIPQTTTDITNIVLLIWKGQIETTIKKIDDIIYSLWTIRLTMIIIWWNINNFTYLHIYYK